MKLYTNGWPIEGSWVKTLEFSGSILDVCKQCPVNDDWTLQVRGRVEYLNDLHAMDTIYHHFCSTNFRTLKSIPQQYASIETTKPAKVGLPPNKDQESAFSAVCDYLEKNDDEITIPELVLKTESYLGDPESVPYSSKHMKRKLIEKYGDCVQIVVHDGLSDLVTMRETSNFILRNFYDQSRHAASEEAQKLWIKLESAARLLKSDIRKVVPSKGDMFPSSNDMELDAGLRYLPDSLRRFCDSVRR